MGQAASMCRFRGCRYKKNKSNKHQQQQQQQQHLQETTVAIAINNNVNDEDNSNNNSPMMVSGLHLRSIEEPPTQPLPTLIHNRMPAEQGGTGYGSESNLLLGSRTGVPLQQPQQNHNVQYPLLTTVTYQRSYDAEHARMEAWMDENPEFVQDYFIRKATRQVVDAWLVSHATSAGNDVVGTPPHAANGQNCSSRGGSGATTPVRKISAHEFERGGLLKPIVNTIDGTPTFLSVGTQNDCGTANNSTAGSVNSMSVGNNSQYYHHHNNHYNHHGQHHYYSHHQTSTTANGGGSNAGTGAGAGMTNIATYGNHNYHYRPQRLSRNELKQLDEKELIFELVKDICNELEIRSLCHKILQNVSILLNADRGSLFLVQGRCNGSDGPKKCLVSKLFDVCPRSTIEEMEQQEEVRVAWGTGIAGHVAESGEPVNIPDAYQDNRFNCEIDSLTGYRTKALLCMPIKDSSGDVVGVAQVINKLNGECFSETDEKVFASYLQFCGIGLRNAQLYEKSQLEIKRNQVLLDLARMIFEEQSTIELMVFRILTHMQSLIQCQRVQILLVHEASKGSFSRVFDFEANDLSEEDTTTRTSPFESRFPINVGITGHVATTGETVNIPNAYDDDRFDPSVDESSCFKHKSILCMAIKNSLGQIIGVIQLINKFDDLNFTKNDENFVEAFAIFCGMGIHNTHMYEKAIVAMAKQSVTLEVLSYHASATIDEAHRLRRLRVPSAAHFRLHDFKFDDIHFEDDDTLKACLRMFLDLDFVERFHIDYEVLCRWLLSVKKNYRNVTYHNWRHAFNVAQMMFAILTTTQWWKIFGEIECLALIIGCLCHDLDHRGTNNSFQIKASSPLAQLYSTSTMEHHHFDQCLMILNSPGNQILANLTSEDYCRVIRVLEDAILSTDLAVYFKKRGPFLQCVQEKPMSYWVAEEPRALLRAMSMTVCDLSAITKPWEIEKRVADLVSSEFFEQGDMEKQELNITPIDIMNREKEDELPMMQVNFINSICLPIYEAFAHLSDKLEPLVDGVRENRQHWLELDRQNKLTMQKSNCLAIMPPNSTNNNNNLSDNNNDFSSDTNNDSDITAIPNGNQRVAEDFDNDSEDIEKEIESIIADDEDFRYNEDGDDDAKNNIEKYSDCADDGDDEQDEDEEDVVCVINEIHSDGCHSSASSHISTPPPTGEDDDDSSPTSPLKLAQAKMIATNLNNLNQTKSRGGCRKCECNRLHHQQQHENLRKVNSLKNTLEQQSCSALVQNGCNQQSKSTPMMAVCGVTRNTAHQHEHHYHHHQHNHQQHEHAHHHHHYHHHHHHGYRHQQHNQQHSSTNAAAIAAPSTTSSSVSAAAAPSPQSSESDKIPKIVGKLASIDSMQQLLAAGSSTSVDGLHLQPLNGLNFTPNGHFNYMLPGNNALLRRNSETNRPATLDVAKVVVTCDK